MSLPEIVLVPGAWHKPKHYASYITDLEKAGFTVHTPRLPTSNGTRPPTASLPEDVNHVRDLVQTLVSANKRVIMIMHSYGGLVGTSAIQDLDLPTRKASNQPGGVVHLLYLCAYILSPGETMWKIVEEAGFAELWPQLAEEHEDGTFFPRDPGTAFFSGLEESSFVNEVVESLERFPTRGLREEATGDAWRRLPVTYVKTQRDITLPVTAQEAMLGRVRGEGVVVRVEEFDTHHSPWVSMPEEVVRVAVEVASDARNPE